MNVFILGNGFDLQHGFLTKYINFLNIIEFLTENYDEKKMNTIGDVLSSPLLQQKDTDVKNSYELHKDIYYSSYLDPSKTSFLIQKAKENLWFQYFLSSVNKDVGWIDFEKEIGEVVEVFRELMRKITYGFAIEEIFYRQPIKKDIIRKFNYFYSSLRINLL